MVTHLHKILKITRIANRFPAINTNSCDAYSIFQIKVGAQRIKQRNWFSIPTWTRRNSGNH